MTSVPQPHAMCVSVIGLYDRRCFVVTVVSVNLLKQLEKKVFKLYSCSLAKKFIQPRDCVCVCQKAILCVQLQVFNVASAVRERDSW